MYISVIILQIFCIVSNSFLTTVFLTNTKIRNNKSLYFVVLLCIINSLFSLLGLPFIVYQLIMVGKNAIIFNPFLLAIASTPIMINFKMNLVITIMIAIDRVQAIKYPLHYRNKNHKNVVFLTLITGVIAGFIDTVIAIETVDYSLEVYGCLSIGCFQTIVFPIYWSSNNMILEIILFVLTLIMIYELSKRMKAKKKQPQNALPKNSNNNAAVRTLIKNANKLSLEILLTSFTFLFIPSIIIVFDLIFRINLFNRIGPFYAIGLIFTGILNSILYIILHTQIRESVIFMVLRKSKNSVFVESTTNPITRFN